MKIHQFWLDLGSLGKFEPQVSDKKMREVLHLLFPNYEELTHEKKHRAWKEVRRVVYKSLKKGYEKKYARCCPPTVHTLTTWTNNKYKESANV